MENLMPQDRTAQAIALLNKAALFRKNAEKCERQAAQLDAHVKKHIAPMEAIAALSESLPQSEEIAGEIIAREETGEIVEG